MAFRSQLEHVSPYMTVLTPLPLLVFVCFLNRQTRMHGHGCRPPLWAFNLYSYTRYTYIYIVCVCRLAECLEPFVSIDVYMLIPDLRNRRHTYVRTWVHRWVAFTVRDTKTLPKTNTICRSRVCVCLSDGVHTDNWVGVTGESKALRTDICLSTRTRKNICGKPCIYGHAHMLWSLFWSN